MKSLFSVWTSRGFIREIFPNAFFAAYTRRFPCIEVEEDNRIFSYFKCLRANVRAKVHAMSAAMTRDPHEVKRHTTEIKKYLTLMKGYMRE